MLLYSHQCTKHKTQDNANKSAAIENTHENGITENAYDGRGIKSVNCYNK